MNFVVYQQMPGRWHFRRPTHRRPHRYSTGYRTREEAILAAEDAERSEQVEAKSRRKQMEAEAGRSRLNHPLRRQRLGDTNPSFDDAVRRIEGG